MKSTKRILSAILSVIMILGCITVGFTAQASAADLVEAVKKGGEVNWKSGDVTLTETLVIDGDVSIDFNGAVVTGPEDKAAIVVNSGNVTLYDVVVIANNKAFSGETQFLKTLMNYKPAISINGGDVKLNCVTAVGSVIRIPNSGTVEVPIGNGINANAGKVRLDNVIAIGMKALDNTKAEVSVGDAILAGIYKAANIYTAVKFDAGYKQYQTVDMLDGFLKDGVNLSASEKKYIASATNSQGDFSFGSVVVNVKKPSFNELNSVYNNGVLSVFAPEEFYTEKDVSNRYSYKYTPDYCEVNGQKAEFKLIDGNYVAEFKGLAENNEYSAKTNYDLSVKLGKKQKEIVEGALNMLAKYAQRAPELLARFVDDFEALYAKAETYGAYVYNLLTDSSTDILSAAQKNALKPDLLGITYALEGATFNGSENDVIKRDALDKLVFKSAYDRYNTAPQANKPNADYLDLEAFETRVKNTLDAKFGSYTKLFGDSLFAYSYDVTYDVATEEYDAAKIAKAYGAGKGLLEVFREYYNGIMTELYNYDVESKKILDKKSFKNIGAAAKYVGDNWEGILELAENAVVVLDKMSAILNDSGNNSALNSIVNKLIGSGNLTTYVNAFNTGVKYVHKVMDRVEEVKSSDFVNKYGAKAGMYCERYALKAWDIVTTPDKYFTVDVQGDYVNVDLAGDELFATTTVNTNVEAKDVFVLLNTTGMGTVLVNGVVYDCNAACEPIWFAYGEKIEIVPVADEGYAFRYMVVESDGNQNVVDGTSMATRAATNLKVVVNFEDTMENDSTEVIFMTDKALNYKYLAGSNFTDKELTADKWSYKVGTLEVKAPVFKDLDAKGWSTDKDAAEGVTLEEVREQVVNAANDGVVVVYALYTFDEEVEVAPQDEVVKVTPSVGEDDGIAYFDLSVQLKGKKAIQAGVILTRIAAYATEDAMKVTLSETPGVTFSRVKNADCFDADGYLVDKVVYTAGVNPSASGNAEVYGRGYVVYADGTVEYTPVYTLVN